MDMEWFVYPMEIEESPTLVYERVSHYSQTWFIKTDRGNFAFPHIGEHYNGGTNGSPELNAQILNGC